MKKININADMGESFGAYKMGDDTSLAGCVQSANIACGFHGGDPLVIQNCMRLCHEKGVSLGAHPSFYDLQGFGRREMHLSSEELSAILTYQIGALKSLAHVEGSEIKHVKPHGAMNNMACCDLELSKIICSTIKEIDEKLILLAPALSKLSQAGKEAGLKVVEEIYADRIYEEDATLMSRKKEGAVLHDPMEIMNHVDAMIKANGIVTHSGKIIPCQIESICVHGDNPTATYNAIAIHKALNEKGYELVPVCDL